MIIFGFQVKLTRFLRCVISRGKYINNTSTNEENIEIMANDPNQPKFFNMIEIKNAPHKDMDA